MRLLGRMIYVLLLAIAVVSVGCAAPRNIDSECYDKVTGEYQAQAQDNGNDDDYVGSWWHLSIGEDEAGKEYFSIYDNGAGNPGISGAIVTLDDSNIEISIDEEYYDELPSAHWQTDGGRLKLTYEMTDKGIELTNNDFTILFIDENAPKVICAHWKAEDSKELTNIEFENDHVCLEGWFMNYDGTWEDVPTSIFMSEDCRFVDKLLGRGEVSLEEFKNILKRDDVTCSVIELVSMDYEITEIRLVGPDESGFAE